MSFIQNSMFFIVSLLAHLLLLSLFSLSFYYIYFLGLFFILYIFRNFHFIIEYKIFFFYLASVLLLINFKIYDEYFFEFLIYFGVQNWSIYINSEVMYVLIILHLILLINLNKFESFWAIMDKKLFRT